VAQKTWNLRRPVTLIGSKRPAHIVLHDKNVSRAHCVIVNTGVEVLLKDLHTSGGTSCNDERVDLTVLKDGDVVSVGKNRIQVAIHVPDDLSDDSGCGVEFKDPTKLPGPLILNLIHTAQKWVLHDAVTLVGRHDAAPVRLDHDKIAKRHAVVFRFANESAIFNMGGEDTLAVNGDNHSLCALCEGDRVSVGPFGLRVGDRPSSGLLPSDTVHGTTLDEDEEAQSDEAPADLAGNSGAGLPSPLADLAEEAADLINVESKLESIKHDIGDSWEQLNTWQSQLVRDASQLDRQERNLAGRTESLDAKDAAVRGQLHDVTRFQDELQSREQELAAQWRKFQEEKDTVAAAQSARAKQQADLEQRTKDLARREHVLAQRWSRLQAAKCPHCGKPTNMPDGGPPKKR